MKKRILSLLLAATMALGLVGCGGKTDNQGTANSGSGNAGTQTSDNTGSKTESVYSNFTVPEGGYDGSEVTIKFYHTMGANLKSVLDIYIEEFNKLSVTLFPGKRESVKRVGISLDACFITVVNHRKSRQG